MIGLPGCNVQTLMTQSLAVTIIGPDKPGLIDRVASIAAAHEADWLESYMANLVGQFAGIVHLKVPAQSADALSAALEALSSDGLSVAVARGTASGEDSVARRLTLEITGHDHPGIVRDISHALALRDVSIESLETRREEASQSGEMHFHATAMLSVPDGVVIEDLYAAIEALSGEIMVDAVLGSSDSA